MLVKKIVLENFKGTAKKTVALGPGETVISGKNRAGKSTIGEAIVFALYGVTIKGSPRCDNLLKQGAKKAVVTLEIDVNGETYTVERTKTRKGTEVTLNGVKVAQADIDSLLGLTAEEFLAMYNPLYLIKSEPSKAREFFVSLLEPPTLEEVLKEMLPEQAELLKGVSLGNPDMALKQHRDELKGLQKEIAKAEGAADELKSQIESVRKELSNLAFDEETTRREISLLKEKIETIKVAAEPKRPDDSEIKILNEKVNAKRQEYLSLSEQKQRLLRQMPPKPGEVCPTCGQTIPKDRMAAAIEKWQAQVEKVKESVSEIDRKMAQVAEEGKNLAHELTNAQTVYKVEMNFYETALANWQSKSACARDELKSVTEQIEKLQKAQASYTALVEQCRSLEERLAETNKALGADRDVARRLEETIQAINEFRFKFVELQMKQLKPHLKHVDVTLFEVAKSTGEIKPTFIITYDGKPVQMLSTSEEILAGLEITLLVQKLKNVTVPVFVDNAESITDLDLPDGRQYLVARAVPGKELTIEALSEKSAA